MQQSGYNAPDLTIGYEADIAARRILLTAGWIDTGLLEWFLACSLLQEINHHLDESSAKFESLDSFDIEVVVASKKGSARFSVQRIERDFEPSQPTLVMSLKG